MIASEFIAGQMELNSIYKLVVRARKESRMLLILAVTFILQHMDIT